MTTILQIVRYELRNVVRNRWVIAYALFFLVVTELLLRLGGSSPHALLSLMNVVLLIIPLVTIVFGTIYWHGSREFTELLLAQPVPRAALFHGLFAGLVLPLSAAFVAGVSVPLILRRGLTAALIGGLVDDRLKGLGMALGVWVLVTLAYDGLVLWVTVAFGRYPLEAPLLALTFANPVDLARVLLMLRFDVAALMGYTGAVFDRLLGSATGTLTALTGLALWTLVPGLLALRAFRRKDF
jgi:Cu-processing system permease protein